MWPTWIFVAPLTSVRGAEFNSGRGIEQTALETLKEARAFADFSPDYYHGY